VLDFTRIDASAAHRLRDDMGRQFLRLRIVEGAAIGPADRRAGGRYDDGFAHLASPWTTAPSYTRKETAMPENYPLPSADPASVGFAATPLQHLDRLIRQHIEEGRYPGAQIALARHGKLALFRTYGDAKTEGQNRPATDSTLFLLFSQTKVLTSCAVWTLIQEGKLSF